MNKTDKIFVHDILESIVAIEKYTQDLTYQDFLHKKETQDAVLRRLQIVGEASKKVFPETKKKFYDVPWQKMMGVRNMIVHQYFGVDLLNIIF